MELLELCVDEQITLRPFTLEDADVLFELTDNNRQYLSQWLRWVDTIHSVDDAVAFIQTELAGAAKGTKLGFVILYNNVPVGSIEFVCIDKTNRQAAIGYWISQEFQGLGIITRACRFLTSYGFTSLNLHRIEIRCATGNTKSRAIPERLGFVQEGILRDAQWLRDHFVDGVSYSKLASDT